MPRTTPFLENGAYITKRGLGHLVNRCGCEPQDCACDLHDHRELAPHPHVLTANAKELDKLRDRADGKRQDALELLTNQQPVFVDPGQDQRILVGKELVNRTNRNVRISGDVLNGRSANTKAAKASLGGIENALALKVTFGCGS